MEKTDLPDDFDSQQEQPEAPVEQQPVDVDALLRSAEVRLGGFDAQATGRALRLSDRSIKFGLCLLAGMSATAAARMVGFAGEGSVLRSSASKCARSKAMQAFLKAAKEHQAGVSEAPLTEGEKLRILARGARGANPAVQIRATLAHHEIERDLAQQDPEDFDPEKQLLEIASISPTAAAEIAGRYGFSLDSLPADIRAQAEGHQEQLAKNWIRDNPAEAKAYADFFLRPFSPVKAANGAAA